MYQNDTNTDIDIYNKTGVYKLNCNDCNSFYIDVYKRQRLCRTFIPGIKNGGEQ